MDNPDVSMSIKEARNLRRELRDAITEQKNARIAYAKAARSARVTARMCALAIITMAIMTFVLKFFS